MTRRPSEDRRTVPLHEEAAKVAKRTVERRARVSKRVRSRTETVGTTLRREQPLIERVPINRTIAEPPPVRQEGDTLVIPVLEEVVVVERRLVLREEIRIRRHQIVEPFRQDVALRAEEVVIEPPSHDEGGVVSSTQTIEHGKED